MSLCNLLRVPPIFVMDELFKNSFGLPEFSDILFPANNNDILINATISQISESTQYYKVIFLSFFKIIISCLTFCLTSCLFVLPSKYLFIVYLHLVSICVVLVSYWTNMQAMKFLSGRYEYFNNALLDEVITWDVNGILHIFTKLQILDFFFVITRNIIIQSCLSLVFDFLHIFSTYRSLLKIHLYNFTIPTAIALIPGTQDILSTVAVLTTLLPLFIMLQTLWLNIFTITNLIQDAYNSIRDTIDNYGISSLIETEWNRLNIPSVLRIFWAIRVLEQILYLLTDMEMKNETLYGTLKYLLIKGCDTFTAVLGMTSFVSYFCHYIGAFFQWVLLTDDMDDKSIGTISAVLFYILSLQTGLTGLAPEKRFIRLYRNVCLLCAALLHYIHNIVNPLLMSLSASHNPSLNRHLRALLVCGFLIVFPILMLTYLWSHHSISTWLLAVSSFNIEIIIKVLVSLAVYSLFLIDAYRTTFWEKLDDYVYYIKSFGNTVEFCFGIFLFLNGVYIMAFVSGGAVRAAMMCVHAYFNIWCDARDGWRVFIKRRTAVKKIESLPEATSIQLAKLDDVCAICYQNMNSAKITKCNHYFHGVCLRKWLYVQDRCPLCHDILYKAELSNVQSQDTNHLQDLQNVINADNS
ncbi:Zinc finger, RING-type,Zinc finger, RING/FYVE/PHD-type,TRC8 N-terminal domain [Cinara cedri]|uniref:Zinc finger, RING-type,Zinc finger, RING/FYVE/PHD-type,TRC8 N-terminal domain n=1 Tax=Cinara cedri TaxID=506608 RepID=A0A5E4MVH7_9HEMI|nr:Zinc finger, RING-type,Zinc finger, RING/FYVE/PHD-type,TRC8 N-terminal domain [Cinara cedri]